MSNAQEDRRSLPLKAYDVLIVEDEMITGMLIKAVVEELECNVVKICINADDALEAFKNNNVDIILMDIFLMGSISGIEITKILNEQYNFKNVIYITANTDAKTRKDALETSHIAYMEKPVSNDILEEILVSYKPEK